MRTVYTSVLLPTGACSGRRFALLPLPCEGIVLKNFYFRTKRFLLLIKAVLFQISGLERISLHNGAVFPEFVGPHRNALRGIDATNVNTTTFFCFKKNPVFCSRLSDTPPQKRHQAACHLYASHSSSLFRASRK